MPIGQQGMRMRRFDAAAAEYIESAEWQEENQFPRRRQMVPRPIALSSG